MKCNSKHAPKTKKKYISVVITSISHTHFIYRY